MLDRAAELLDPARSSARLDVSLGYLDALDAEPPPTSGIAQSLMRTSVLPMIYERWWRPLGARVAIGARTSPADERRRARELLRLGPGDVVLDVACGPGNFTRNFAACVCETGLAVGIDASSTMLGRAVADTAPGQVAYVRGDALALPFRDESFDAACCFAALYLFDEPFRAVDEMARVLKPGGRIAILTGARSTWAPARAVESAFSAVSGLRLFERSEVTGELADRGFVDIRRDVAGLAQFVGARKPA